MESFTKRLCLLSYAVSAVLALLVGVKIVDVRSKCTKERAKISRLISDIKALKDENNRLLIEFYRETRPGVVDKSTNSMKFLHEDEVKYLR